MRVNQFIPIFYSGGNPYETEYQAVLDYATAQGFAKPTADQQIKQNQLLKDLKTAGIWAKLDTFAVFANDGGANFGLIDWKRLTTYTAYNSPSFTTNKGFTGNGTSAYIDTNFNPATQGINYVQNNASRYFYLDLAGTGQYDMSGTMVSAINRMEHGSGTRHTINQSSNVNSASFIYLGNNMKSIHRTSGTDISLANAASITNLTSTSVSVNSATQILLRSAVAYATHRVSMYAMGAELTAKNTDFVNAFDTYFSGL
jgi:hypothetical protein